MFNKEKMINLNYKNKYKLKLKLQRIFTEFKIQKEFIFYHPVAFEITVSYFYQILQPMYF
jgi:hypothetical protein